MSNEASLLNAPLTTPENAAALLRRVLATVDALSELVAEETCLVRAGHLLAARDIQTKKAELARHYVFDMQIVQANAETIKRLAPGLVETLRARHEALRPSLTRNMNALTTAKSIAENIVQQIAAAVALQNKPAAYNRKGIVPDMPRGLTPPISVSRQI